MALLAVIGAAVAGPGNVSAGSVEAAAAMPCTTTIARANAVRQLNISLDCTVPQVVIVRFDFTRGVKLVGQRAFGGSYCSGRGTSVWYCVFPGGISASAHLSGSLTLQKRAPAQLQSVRTTFYTSSTIGSASLELDPAQTVMLSY
jgi:hypothetical protein